MKIVLLVILCCLARWGSAQEPSTFDHLNIEEGLANNSVRSIIQDRDGYLWFGTLNGLSRYDGQSFQNFYYNPNNAASISNNKIRDMFQDGAGYIWLTTYDDQAHRYDPRSEEFVNLPAALSDTFNKITVEAIYESSPGVVWLYLENRGCLRIISSENTSDFQWSWFNQSNLLPSDEVNFCKKATDGGLWIGTSAGLCHLANDRMAPETRDSAQYYLTDNALDVCTILDRGDSCWLGCRDGEFIALSQGQEKLLWKSNNNNNAFNQFCFIEQSRNGLIYGGTRNGLVQYDPASGAIHHLTARNSGLITNYISSCYQDQEGDLWLVSNLRGVIRFQPATMQFTHFELSPDIRQSIVEGEKQIFVEDQNKNLWVGIYGGGISRFNRETEHFEQFLHQENNPGSLSSNLVLSLFGDRSGNLWVGTYKRGLNKINLQKNNFHNNDNTLSANSNFQTEVRALFEDSRHWIWTGNKRGDILVYNQQMELLFKLNDFLADEQITAGIYCFEEDRQRNIWIGTKGNGIVVLKGLPTDGQHRRLNPELVRYAKNSGENSISYNDVFDLHLDSKGQMWVGSYHGGINIIRHAMTKNQQILRYLQNSDDRFSITDNRVRCFLEDSQHNMWIGTANGLNFVSANYQESDNKRFIPIFQENRPSSLSYNDIICLFEDSQHTIWVGTYGGGINRYTGLHQDRRFDFEQIKKQDGLSSDLVLGFVEDQDRNLWVSTDFGLAKINTQNRSIENFYESDGLPENAFSESTGICTRSNYILFGHLSGFLWFQPGQIKKQERQVPVVLTDLQVNNQTNRELLSQARRQLKHPQKPIKLRYKQNFISFGFAALDYKAPSKIQYEFKLENYERGWNKNGNLNKAIYRELQPGSYIFRLRASNSDGLWVNPELQLPFTISPPPWRTGWAYLLYLLLASGLFVLIRRITLERIKLKHEVEFEKQLADDKLKFYTSISHEFKTPLALILGPVEDLLASRNLPPNVSGSLRMVKRNTRRLLELIEQLMDFRKIQKGFMDNEISPGNLVYFLEEIVQAFQTVADKKQINFSFVSNADRLDASMNYKSLEKIVFNLLSNAFKHTAEQQAVHLQLVVDTSQQTVALSVTDEGEGIREQDMPHLFERFTFGRRSKWKDESSTGIGLSLTKELVELMNGEIRVESTFGKGSCFTVSLPYVPTEAPSAHTHDLAYTTQFIEHEEPAIPEPPETTDNRRMVKKQTILVVEDNPDLRSWLATQLGQYFHVLQAENGKIGVEIARKEDPQLIICDIMMPEMDGIELTSVLKSEFHTSHIPIILLTAKSLEEHKIEGIETGADDYITKPFNMIYLRKRVENILRQRKQLRERFSRDVNAEPKELSPSTADQEFMNKVIALIEEQMTDPEFSIDNLLPHFSFGRTVFYKKMKGISGYSPKDFVRIIRMKKAGKLLSDSSVTVSEVAFEVGFSDANYFSKQFKKHFGETPSEFQKKQA
ncbi:two-component regulator propeller domain-containing protein [Mangrovibacterium marinum]|uniref:histidine kinase n=1 Tax=Mangrovibacterium marinum TaxID=1639118 RepID=A0A2T5C668_9BACT|nr:two-component regulator propeller domain-containing protein [Mangrovibacterium marinum]PTN10445.1 signal transduction histidine kinase [Mangrovibacterium marinum]